MSLAAALLDLLFPPRCAACRVLLDPSAPCAAGLLVCADCAFTLDPMEGGCPRCGLDTFGEGACDACRAESPPFDSVRSAFRYGGAVSQILQRYKYGDRPELASPLGTAIVAVDLPEADVVVPVPLHPSRRRARTYDQALYLAQVVARARGIPCRTGLLSRTRSTERQVGKTRRDRALNVEGAFVACQGAAGLRVLLVDDVVTTGATVAECARVLKQAGARQVHVASVARAT